jgi:hypothetical protein
VRRGKSSARQWHAIPGRRGREADLQTAHPVKRVWHVTHRGGVRGKAGGVPAEEPQPHRAGAKLPCTMPTSKWVLKKLVPNKKREVCAKALAAPLRVALCFVPGRRCLARPSDRHRTGPCLHQSLCLCDYDFSRGLEYPDALRRTGKEAEQPWTRVAHDLASGVF